MAETLYRSRREKMLGGVCGGLAEYFHTDVVLVRLITVLAVLAGGAGFLAYIVAWVIIPENPESRGYVQRYSATPDSGATPGSGATRFSTAGEELRQHFEGENKKLLGGVLVFLGFLFLLDRWFPLFSFGRMWPLILIGIGAFIIWRRGDN